MPNPTQYNRHSIRLKEYDYSLEGAYFVTLITYHRMHLFGDIIHGINKLSPYGHIAFNRWTQLGKRFPQSDFSTFVIMPNHVHGIIFLVRDANMESQLAKDQSPILHRSRLPKIKAITLGTIVRAYKASVTFRINAMSGFNRHPVWQRNYYEQIISNEKELDNIWKYIEANPDRWGEDKFYS